MEASLPALGCHLPLPLPAARQGRRAEAISRDPRSPAAAVTVGTLSPCCASPGGARRAGGGCLPYPPRQPPPAKLSSKGLKRAVILCLPTESAPKMPDFAFSKQIPVGVTPRVFCPA